MANKILPIIVLLAACSQAGDDKSIKERDKAALEETGQLQERIEALEKQVEAMQARLDSQHVQIEGLEGKSTTLETTIEGQSVDLSGVQAEIAGVNSTLNYQIALYALLASNVTNLDARMDMVQSNVVTTAAPKTLWMYDANGVRRHRTYTIDPLAGEVTVQLTPSSAFAKYTTGGQLGTEQSFQAQGGLYLQYLNGACSGQAYAIMATTSVKYGAIYRISYPPPGVVDAYTIFYPGDSTEAVYQQVYGSLNGTGPGGCQAYTSSFAWNIPVKRIFSGDYTYPNPLTVGE